MAITCEVKLAKHSDDVYRPGAIVQGVVNYATSKDAVFNAITVSLTGRGCLEIKQTIKKDNDEKEEKKYSNEEIYADAHINVIGEKTGVPTSAGQYEVPFQFILPENIPPTFKYCGSLSIDKDVFCNVAYFLRVKFSRPELFKRNRTFEKEIKVRSAVTPKLPSHPISHSIEKKPFQPFTIKKKAVSIEGILLNPITTAGGNVRISYKVKNETNLDIKDIKIKLMEQTAFYSNGYFSDLFNVVKINSCKATPITAGDSQEIELIVDVPTSVVTIQHSNLFSRDYFVDIVADLSGLHRDVVLRMPIDIVENTSNEDTDNSDDPPSYCEAMEESKKDDFQ